MATSPCDGSEENAFAAQSGAALVPKEHGPDLIAPVKAPDVRATQFYSENLIDPMAKVRFLRTLRPRPRC